MSRFNLFNSIFEPARARDTAILYEGRAITYDELRAETVAIAERLNATGLSAGERVCLLLNDSPEFIAFFLAACSLGAITVPVNMALRADEHEFILKDCAARIVIIEAEAVQTLFGGSSEEFPHLENIFVVRRNRDFKLPDNAGAKVEFISEAKREPLKTFPTVTDEDASGFILYTSGSTGEPKGAVHRLVDIRHTVRAFCEEVLKVRRGDRLFSSSRLPFAYGLGNAFSFPLSNGATTVLCRERPLPEIISRVFKELQPTIFFGVPVVYKLLLDYHRRVENLECASLRVCVSAGEALPARLCEEWQETFGIELLDGIGSTEMLHMFISNYPGRVRYGSSGEVLPRYEVKLIDDAGEPVGENQIGNLWVKVESAASGYWRREEATARTFVGGWVRTGDLYRRDADGYYFHVGRSDDCFKSKGQWVSPVEVEGVLIRQSGVQSVAVVEDHDEDGLPCVCAFIVAAEIESARLEIELRELARATLPGFKQPRFYSFVEEFPMTATGKIQRFKLRAERRKARMETER